MEGSWRLKGGLGALVEALADRLPDSRKRLNAAVTQLARTKSGVTATVSIGETVNARQTVLSMPPRIAANITFDPPLAEAALTSLQSIPTWMAGQAKAIAVYDTPFWRENGLSGDAQSRCGPMVEIHDASPAQGGPYALFGFIGVHPPNRTDAKVLQHHLTEQFVRLFGPKAAAHKQLYVKDWAYDPYTATKADHAPLFAHPRYGMPSNVAHLWNNQLMLSGSEVAGEFGGYLEGALEAAENTLKSLKAKTGDRDADN